MFRKIQEKGLQVAYNNEKVRTVNEFTLKLAVFAFDSISGYIYIWYPDKIPRDKIPRDKIPRKKYPGDKIPRTKNTPATKYPEPKIPRRQNTSNQKYPGDKILRTKNILRQNAPFSEENTRLIASI